MDSRKSEGKSGSKKLEEKCNGQKKSELNDRDWKSSETAYLDAWQPSEAGQRLAAEMVEMFRELAVEADGSVGVRQIRANHRSVTGWVIGDSRHDPVPFESSLERDFAYLTLFEVAVSRLQAQPITLSFRDKSGRHRRYTPDFLVEYTTRGAGMRHALVEVKYKADLEAERERLTESFEAARAWCQETGHEFFVVTEDHIRTTRLENVKAIYPFCFGIDESRIFGSKVYRIIRDEQPITIADVLQQAGGSAEDRARMQTAIWSLVASGMIWIDMDHPLTPQTEAYGKRPSPEPLPFFARHHLK